MPIERGRLAAAVSLLLVLVATGGTLSTITLLRTMRDVKTALAVHTELLQNTDRLRLLRERKGRQVRNYLLTRDERFLGEIRGAREDFDEARRRLGALVEGDRARELLSEVDRADEAHTEVLERFMGQRGSGERLETMGPALDAAVAPHRARLDAALIAFEEYAAEAVLAERGRILAGARRSMLLVLVLVPMTLGLGVVLVALVLRTASLLRASESALERQLSLVQAANRDLDAFASRAAHDLRGLLAPLSLMADLLRGPKASERAGQVADRMARIARRGQDEIDSLLAFARGGRSVDGSASTPLRAAVEQTVEDLAHAISAAEAEISVDVENVEVAVAPGLLQAIVVNVLGNAVKSLRGQPRRIVRIRGRRENLRCVLEIEDTGPGIAPEIQARIFEPFYRGPGASQDGTGLGLAIVHRIVQAHGGEVSFRSEVGGGTVFRVVLPAAGSARPDGERPLPSAG